MVIFGEREILYPDLSASQNLLQVFRVHHGELLCTV
jgi:hypothetical protein